MKRLTKKKKMELIEEDEFLKSLPIVPKFIFGMIKYNLKEILLVLALLFFGLWLLTSFNYEGEKVKIKPQVNIDINKVIE